jgi:hypothetical protein
MWRLVREGFRFYRSALLISWAFGIGIFVLIIILLAIFGSARERNELLKVAVQVPIPILIASLITGFIATGTERGESRVRVHMMLPVPVRQVSVARVLLPSGLLLIGLVMAHALFAVMLALEGSPALSPRHLTVDFVAMQLLFWLQAALAIREIIELRHRVSWTGALGPTALLAVAGALVVALQVAPIESMGLRVALTAALDVAVGVFTVALFQRRTNFTK